MENFINQENFEDIKEIIENKISDVPGELILLGAVGAVLLSSYLNKSGHQQAAAIIGSLSIPIIGIGIAKYKDSITSGLENFQESQH
jgi:hypothetical protein